MNSMFVTPTNPNIIYVGTNEGVFRSGDGGGTWDSLNEGLLDPKVLQITGSSSLIIARTLNGIYRLADPSMSWTKEAWSSMWRESKATHDGGPLTREQKYGKVSHEQDSEKMREKESSSKENFSAKPITAQELAFGLKEAKSYYDSREYSKTIEMLENIRSKDQNVEDVNMLLAKAYINHATYEFQKGNLDNNRAIELYKKAYNLSPARAEASYNIAACYAKQGNLAEGIRWLEIAYPLIAKQENKQLLKIIKKDPDLDQLRRWRGFNDRFPLLKK